MTAEGPRAAVTDDTVKIITDRLAEEIGEVNRLLRESLDSESDLIREVGEFVAFTGGKKLRPLLLLLSARAMAPERPPPVEVAAAVELIHVATLIHDDVIDKATMRRGKPSVNAKWGDDVAILMADYLYACAFDLALTSLSPEVMRVFTQVTKKMCEGEMLQIRLRDRIYTRQEYFEIIERKTGSLFSACAALGAILADRDEGDVALAGSFGADFGVAFQITDDLLDYTADHEKWGKDIGMDVSSGKQTLPVLLALESADEADRAELNAWIRNGRDPGPVLRIIERHQGMERALEEARRFAARAGEALASIEIADAAARDRLAALPDYVVGRAF